MTSLVDAVVGLIMGSRSDWETMQHAAETLDELEIAYERRVVSAHRTPDALEEYVADVEERGARCSSRARAARPTCRA